MKSGRAKTYLPEPTCLTTYKRSKAGLSEHWTMAYQKDNPPKGALHSINAPTINASNVSAVHTSVIQDIEFICVRQTFSEVKHQLLVSWSDKHSVKVNTKFFCRLQFAHMRRAWERGYVIGTS